MGRLIRAVLLDRFRMLMKSASLISVVFAISALLFAQNAKTAATDTAFDLKEEHHTEVTEVTEVS